MPRGPSTPVRLLAALLLLLGGRTDTARAQLPAPARDMAEHVLAVVRTGDRERIRQLLEEHFAPVFLESYPLDHHVPILASLGRQVAQLETTQVDLAGPDDAALTLEGPGGRLELRLRVEPEPPHRIVYLGWGNAAPELRATSLDDLGAELELLAGRPPFSGVVLVAQAGEVRFHEAYGAADLATSRPNRRDTRFDLGSINKLFTATAVLRLLQDGRLSLDDRIGQFIDGFDSRTADGVTIRHLLQHRSGFGDYLSDPAFEADPQRFRQPSDYLPLARSQPLAFEPGSGQRYSNVGFVLLGVVLERVTGRSYDDVIADLVYRPGSMHTAGPHADAAAARRYEMQHGLFASTDSLYPDAGTPAGGGFAAALDLYHFVQALLDYRLLDAEHTALLLNEFEALPAGDVLPEQFAFAGGAPGVNAEVRGSVPDRTVVVVLSNMDPIAASGIARRIEALAR